jgi:hypothetical protein
MRLCTPARAHSWRALSQRLRGCSRKDRHKGLRDEELGALSRGRESSQSLAATSDVGRNRLGYSVTTPVTFVIAWPAPRARLLAILASSEPRQLARTLLCADFALLGGPEMKRFALILVSSVVALALVGGCSGDDDGDDSKAALTAPRSLKASTVDGKPHLTWTDAENEESYMIERMDHGAGSDWVTVAGAEDLVPNTTQYHDTTADASKGYMYRVMAMKGNESKLSNEVSWP